MKIKKLEEIEENLLITGFRNDKKIGHLCSELEEELDPQELETVTQLAEACYKEGYLDGYRVADWIHRSLE